MTHFPINDGGGRLWMFVALVESADERPSLQIANGIFRSQHLMPVLMPRFADLPLQAPNGLILESIFRVVTAHYGFTIDDLLRGRNSRNLATARHIAAYLASELTTFSLTELGRKFGRHHTSLIYAREKIAARRAASPELERTLEELVAAVRKVSGFPSIGPHAAVEATGRCL